MRGEVTDQLLKQEKLDNVKDLEKRYNLGLSALKRRFLLGIPLNSPNYGHNRNNRDGNLKSTKKTKRNDSGEIRKGRKIRTPQGEFKEDISLSWRELYDWELGGAVEWLEKVKKIPNIASIESKIRNK
jgi:hypothetical protein